MYGPLLELAGAVALLLWGLRMVRTGTTRAFGSDLRRILAAGTRNRIIAFGTGLAVTLGLQSSTATALMVASFSAQGMIVTSMALAMMLGADLGTSIVAQIFTSGIAAVSPILVLSGVIVFNTAQRNRPRAIGRLMVGLGIVLLALKLLVLATAPMRSSPVFIELITALSAAPLLAMLIAAIFALLASSSLAIVLLALSLGTNEVIAPSLIVAVILGANLGSGVLPVIATWRSGNVARRAPFGNLLIRLAGVLLALPFADQAAASLIELTGHAPRLAVDAHLAFNILIALIMLPCTGLLANQLERYLPHLPDTNTETAPRYLEASSLDSPTIALTAAARETMRIGDVVEAMVIKAADALATNDPLICGQIATMDDQVDKLHEAVKLYLSRLSRNDALDEDEAQRATEIISYAINLEHAGDIIDRNLRELIAKKIKNQLSFSEGGKREIDELLAKTLDNLHLAQTVFFERDPKLARRLLNIKGEIREAERASAENHLRRLKAGTPETLLTSSLHLDIIRDLKRVNAHLVSVAYPVLDQ